MTPYSWMKPSCLDALNTNSPSYFPIPPFQLPSLPAPLPSSPAPLLYLYGHINIAKFTILLTSIIATFPPAPDIGTAAHFLFTWNPSDSLKVLMLTLFTLVKCNDLCIGTTLMWRNFDVNRFERKAGFLTFCSSFSTDSTSFDWLLAAAAWLELAPEGGVDFWARDGADGFSCYKEMNVYVYKKANVIHL